MEALLIEEEQEITQELESFINSSILPYYKSWDNEQSIPKSFYKQLSSQGLLGACLPKSFSGQELSLSKISNIITEIAKHDPTIALIISSQNFLVASHIYQFASDEIKNKYLPALSSGDLVGCWALTEPQAGSDAKNIKTWGEKEGNTWKINGKKEFITNGLSSDFIILVFNTSQGISTAIVEKDRPGVKVGKKVDKLGMRGVDTTELLFEDCIIPQENIIGELGKGFYQAMKVLEKGRISLAAIGLGIAMSSLEHAAKYAKERVQFGRTISSFQGISFKLADLMTRIESARLLLNKAIELNNHHHKSNVYASMAKLFTSELAVEASNTAVQILGKNGFSKDYPVEKLFRDSKLCTIGEGTSEIQKVIISKNLFNNI